MRWNPFSGLFEIGSRKKITIVTGGSSRSASSSSSPSSSGGTTGAVQFNDGAGGFAGTTDGSFAFDAITKTLSLIGNLSIGSASESKSILFRNDLYTSTFHTATLSDDRNIALPNKSGTVALVSNFLKVTPQSFTTTTVANHDVPVTSSLLQVTCSADLDELNGAVPETNESGYFMWIHNASPAHTLAIIDQSAGSTAGYQFILRIGTSLRLSPGQMQLFVFEAGTGWLAVNPGTYF